MHETPTALLINPPVYDFALYDLFLKPLGLLRLGSVLADSGWRVSFLNALDYRDPSAIESLGRVRRKPDGTGKFHRQVLKKPAELHGINRYFARYGVPAEILRARVSEFRPDAVFITSGMTYWYRGVSEAVQMCRELWPGVPVVAGGVYASLMPGHCSEVCGPDYILSGSLIGESGGRTSLTSEGAAFGSWLQGRGFPALKPAENLLPLDADCWDDAAVLKLSDGCPMNCSYCASGKLCGGFHAGEPSDAFEMLRCTFEKHGTRNFAFYDDALLYRSDEVFIPFLRQVIDYSESAGAEFNFYTPNAMHIRYMSPDAAFLMKKAGFREVRLGFESASASFHSEYDNKYSGHAFKNTIRMLTDAGFNRDEITVYILAGMPGQRASEVEDTIRFASGERLTLSVSEFSPVPGSPMWGECVKNCSLPIETEPLYHNNSFFPMEWEQFTRDDMQRLKRLSRELSKQP